MVRPDVGFGIQGERPPNPRLGNPAWRPCGSRCRRGNWRPCELPGQPRPAPLPRGHVLYAHGANPRRAKRHARSNLESERSMRLERVEIPCGDVILSGLAYSPREVKGQVCLVLSHGFTASKESLDLLAAYLCARGHECLTYDFRGHKLGASTGDISSASDLLDDLRAAAEFAMSRFQRDGCILVGHSMGALISLLVGAELE